MKNACLLFLLCFSLLQCNSSNNKLAETDPITDTTAVLNDAPAVLKVRLDESVESRPVNLDEIMSVESVIPLETTTKILLPPADKLKIVVSHQYFIVITFSEVIQFARNGTFIRILARAGKGPTEYSNIAGYAVDKDRELFYFSKYNDRQSISVIDLKTGIHQPKIPIPLQELGNKEGMHVGQIIINDDHSLICSVPSQFKSDWTVFEMTPEGKLSGGISRRKDYTLNFIDRWYYAKNNGQLFYREPGNDTLFLLENWKKRASAIFDIADYHESIRRTTFHGERANVTEWKITQQGQNSFIIAKEAVQRTPQGQWTILDTQFILVRKSEKPVTIKSIFVDSLGYALDDFNTYSFPFNQSNQTMILAIDANEFKKEAKSILATKSSNQKILEQVGKLNRKVSEADNPILVIGKMR